MRANPKPRDERSDETSPADLNQLLAQARDAALAGDGFQVGADALLSAWGPYYSREELTRIVTPQRTLARRLAKREPLTSAETDRAMRLARVATEAERVFGDEDKAAHWLRHPNASLNGQSPLGLLWSEAGAHAVEEVLVRIDDGMFG